MSPSELGAFCQNLFEKQNLMLPLWQTISDHFYPERADFTITRNLGTELAQGLVDSYPLIVRRDLANSIGAMMRDGEWFEMGIQGGEADHSGQMWLEQGAKGLFSLMNDRASGFTRATKEADHDYMTFGQTVISCQRNRQANGLLFRTWHLRDCAWWDDETGQVGGLVRKWKPQYHQLAREFPKPGQLHSDIADKVQKKPFQEADIRHIVMPAEMYGDEQIASRYKWVSIYLDVPHQHIIEETGINHRFYAVPRFQTIAGAPYAYSPATVAGLPNARCLQAMTHTLLEAGERYARPPIVATGKALRGDVDLSPDGITYVDDEYDERMGASLRPLMQNMGGFPIGLEMRQSVVDVLSSAFYINKLTLPEVTRDMTAYEVQERMKQFRRENLPLFAPIERDYNGQVCELAFQIAFDSGFFGSPYDIPESLQGNKIEFKFQSPLSQSDEEKKAAMFGQISQLLEAASQFDESVAMNIDFDTAVRDAIDGIGTPAKWMRSIEEVTQGRALMSAAAAAQGVAEGRMANAQATQAEQAAGAGQPQ